MESRQKIVVATLGIAARERSSARRCAVTGSVGKTSVTQAIAAGLALAGPSHNSVKSYNNHIGVPLTLARMPKATQRAVFEIGMNHADEITPLSKFVRPHAVAITTVGPVHIENFPDGETGVAKAKAEIFDGIEPGGIAVLNADNRWFPLLSERARAVGARVLSFGSGEDCDARLTGFEVDGARATVSAAYTSAQKQMADISLDVNQYLAQLQHLVESNEAAGAEVDEFFEKSKEILKIHDKIMSIEPPKVQNVQP